MMKCVVIYNPNSGKLTNRNDVNLTKESKSNIIKNIINKDKDKEDINSKKMKKKKIN